MPASRIALWLAAKCASRARSTTTGPSGDSWVPTLKIVFRKRPIVRPAGLRRARARRFAVSDAERRSEDDCNSAAKTCGLQGSGVDCSREKPRKWPSQNNHDSHDSRTAAEGEAHDDPLVSAAE